MTATMPSTLTQRLRDRTQPRDGIIVNDRVRVPSTETEDGGEGWVVTYEDEQIVVLTDGGLLLTVDPSHVILIGHDPNHELRHWIAERTRLGMTISEQDAIAHGETCGLDATTSLDVLKAMQPWVFAQLQGDVASA